MPADVTILNLLLPAEPLVWSCIDPVKLWRSSDASPNILDPWVLTTLEVTIEDVKLVTVRLATVISDAVNDVTSILLANASESIPPSFTLKVSEFNSIVASSTFTDRAEPPPPASPSPATSVDIWVPVIPASATFTPEAPTDKVLPSKSKATDAAPDPL